MTGDVCAARDRSADEEYTKYPVFFCSAAVWVSGNRPDGRLTELLDTLQQLIKRKPPYPSWT